MKRHLFALGLISVLPILMTSTAVYAQDYQEHGHGWGDQGDEHGHGHGHGHDHGWRDDDEHDHGRHLGWDKHYRRGDYLPERYRVREYYVDDYTAYHLYAPPQGYVWIRGDDGQFVLVALATGLIVNELLGH